MNLDLPITLGWLGWRGALFALVVLLAFYVIVVFLRIRRLKRRKDEAGREAAAGDGEPAVTTSGLAQSQSAVAAYAAVQEPELRTPPEPLAAPSEAAFPWDAPTTEPSLRRRLIGLENELEQLRKEVGGLRAEVLVLREEVLRAESALAQMRLEREQSVHDGYAAYDGGESAMNEEDIETGDDGGGADVAASVSPLYSEAMQYALAGHDAAAISQQCGISRAEAELVVALVRNRDDS